MTAVPHRSAAGRVALRGPRSDEPCTWTGVPCSQPWRESVPGNHGSAFRAHPTERGDASKTERKSGKRKVFYMSKRAGPRVTACSLRSEGEQKPTKVGGSVFSGHMFKDTSESKDAPIVQERMTHLVSLPAPRRDTPGSG
jgi:hypothetical protein